MEKPKGGRGRTAPYETKQMRVPVGLEAQIQELVERYRSWISEAGYSAGIGTGNPPNLLDKPVDNFNQLQSQLEKLREENAQLRSQLEGKSPAANLEGARDYYLASLRLGKQAPEYKRVKATIDRFITSLRK